MSSTNPPGFASPPGESIKAILEDRGISLESFSRLMDWSKNQSLSLLEGKLRISPSIAASLEKAVGSGRSFWLRRETHYRDDLEKKNKTAFYSSFPLTEMKKRGWLAPATDFDSDIENLLKFFDVSSVSAYREKYEVNLRRSLFRTSPSFESELGAVVSWLRQGQIQAAKISCEKWSKEELGRSLPALKSLLRRKDPAFFIKDIKSLLAGVGVAFVIVRAPQGCRASGVVQLSESGNPIILLSCRHLSDDHFWFTLFHEIGHLMLHDQEMLLLEAVDQLPDAQEEEANRFATDLLVPTNNRHLMHNVRRDPREIIKLSIQLALTPGVLVGQMQHHGIIAHSQFNSLKRRFEWEGESIKAKARPQLHPLKGI